MLDWHSCQIYYPFEIKILLLLLLLLFIKEILVHILIRYGKFHRFATEPRKTVTTKITDIQN